MASSGTQTPYRVASDTVPITVEVAGVRVEEYEARQIGRMRVLLQYRRVQGGAECVGGKYVQPTVSYEGRRLGHRVQ